MNQSTSPRIGPIELTEDRWRDLRQDVDFKSPLPRLCYAAAHVVMKSSYRTVKHSLAAPGSPEEIAEHLDWDATMGIRRGLGETGMGIAEAMDSAQRLDLGWPAVGRLIVSTGKIGLDSGFCAGASTDHLEIVDTPSRIVDGIVEQIEFIRGAGGVPVILPIPRLNELGTDEAGHVRVYGDIAREAGDGPLIVDWPGPGFRPDLEGCFPGDSFLRIMSNDPERYRAARLSMLDHRLEVRLRRDLLQRNQIMFTGDDFRFARRMAGEDAGVSPPQGTTEFDGREVTLGDYSHALLGVFDAIAVPAALALRRLRRGDRIGYDRIMGPCERLGRAIFEGPTPFHRTGLAFLAWLDGRQGNPMLINHEEIRCPPERLLEIVRLADAAGAFEQPEVVAARLESITKTRPHSGLGDLARGAAGIRDQRRPAP